MEAELNEKKNENICMKRTLMEQNSSETRKGKSSIQHRGLSAELMNELFASLPIENAFCFLIKIPNGLLARNVQKMINGIKETMKNNKLNEEDCGPKLTILDEGLLLKHSGPYGINVIRAVLPIPIINLAIDKPKIDFYFEVQILNKNWEDGIYIGFCDKNFSLEGNYLGDEDTNSIGICHKCEIWIDGTQIRFGNIDVYFKKLDIIGIGIIHHPNSKIKCFATCNGKLLEKGKAELPKKFANIPLFPAISLMFIGESIRVNFGKDEWKFKEFKRVLE